MNGVLHEVENGERVKPRGTDALECACHGAACDDIAIEYPGEGFVVRNTGRRRVRVSLQVLSGWSCGAWSHVELGPDRSAQYPTGGYCCPYEANYL